MMEVNLQTRLQEIVGNENVVINKPLKQHTYTKLGGNADYFVTPTAYEQVSDVIKLANQQDVPLMLLGNGSNLIIKDGGKIGRASCRERGKKLEVAEAEKRKKKARR